MAPLVAAAGTVAVIWESDQAFTDAVPPVKLKVLVPWVAPKPVPLI